MKPERGVFLFYNFNDFYELKIRWFFFFSLFFYIVYFKILWKYYFTFENKNGSLFVVFSQ